MSIAFPFQIEGCTGEFSSEINGYLFTATIKLFEVNGSNDIAQAFNALIDGNVPLVGTDLSGIDLDLTGCWLRNIKSIPLGDHQWQVTITYQHSPFNTLGALQVSTGTQVSQVESNKDKDGNSIVLVYDYPADYGGTSASERDLQLRSTTSGEQGGTFSKLVPESNRIYTVRQAEDGDEIARTFVGTVNDDTWQGGAAGTWMLTGVTGATDDSLQTPAEWVNSYTFQYRSDGWKPEVVFVDPNTNEPVPDPVLTDSKVVVDAYDATDFTLLFAAVDP